MASLHAGAQAIANEVAKLAENRCALVGRTEEFKRLEGRFLGDVKYLTEEIALLKAEIVQAEISIKNAAVAHYRATGEVKPTAGVAVKLFDTLCYDPKDADAWTREVKLARIPESLDVKSFEKIAKSADLPFVTFVPEPRATIATDLPKVLAEETV